MKVNYRNIKYPRLELRTGNLFLILPQGIDPYSLLEKYSGWITKKKTFINNSLLKSKNIKIERRDLNSIKRIVFKLINEYSNELGIVVPRVVFRKLKSKWGSCSKYGNLTFNKDLKHLPIKLIKYIVFHEMAHFVSRKHDGKFWKIVESKFKNHQHLEVELFSYWFLIKKNEI